MAYKKCLIRRLSITVVVCQNLMISRPKQFPFHRQMISKSAFFSILSNYRYFLIGSRLEIPSLLNHVVNESLGMMCMMSIL